MFFVLVDAAIRKGHAPDAFEQGLFSFLVQVLVDLAGKFIERRGIVCVAKGVFQNFLGFGLGYLMCFYCAINNGLQFALVFILVDTGKLNHQCRGSHCELMVIGLLAFSFRCRKQFFQALDHDRTVPLLCLV